MIRERSRVLAFSNFTYSLLSNSRMYNLRALQQIEELEIWLAETKDEEEEKMLTCGITMRKHSWAQEDCGNLCSTVGGVLERHSLGRVKPTRNSLHLVISHSESMRVRLSVDCGIGLTQRLAIRTIMEISYYMCYGSSLRLRFLRLLHGHPDAFPLPSSPAAPHPISRYQASPIWIPASSKFR